MFLVGFFSGWRWPGLLFLATVLPGVEVALESASTAVGQRHQWVLVNPPPEWLERTDIRLDILDGPRLVTRFGYLDADHVPSNPGAPDSGFRQVGRPCLRFRHTPRFAGTLTWTLRGPDARISASGSQLVSPSGPGPGSEIGGGPVRISAANPRLLALADGTPFIPIGPNLAWADGPDRARQWHIYVNEARQAGCTHARLWLASWSGQTHTRGPERLDHAWLMDHYLDSARQAGLRITLVLDNHHDRAHQHDPELALTIADQARALVQDPLHPRWVAMVRYHLARWGADDVIAAFEPMNEPDLLEPDRGRLRGWMSATRRLFKDYDPDQRLLTMGWSGGDVAATTPFMDMLQPHAYIQAFLPVDQQRRHEADDIVDWLSRLARGLDKNNKPWWFGEVGFQSAPDNSLPGEDRDQAGLVLLQLAWGGWLLGGAGPASHWWWDRHIHAHGLWHVYRGQAAAALSLDWREPGLLPLLPGNGPIRVLGWRSRTQALLWFNVAADTWRRVLLDGQPRIYPDPATVARLGGFAPGDYQVTYRHWASGVTLTVRPLTAENGILAVPAGPPDSVATVRLVPVKP